MTEIKKVLTTGPSTGGNATLKKYGKEHYREISKKGLAARKLKHGEGFAAFMRKIAKKGSEARWGKNEDDRG